MSPVRFHLDKTLVRWLDGPYHGLSFVGGMLLKVPIAHQNVGAKRSAGVRLVP